MFRIHSGMLNLTDAGLKCRHGILCQEVMIPTNVGGLVSPACVTSVSEFFRDQSEYRKIGFVKTRSGAEQAWKPVGEVHIVLGGANITQCSVLYFVIFVFWRRSCTTSRK